MATVPPELLLYKGNNQQTNQPTNQPTGNFFFEFFKSGVGTLSYATVKKRRDQPPLTSSVAWGQPATLDPKHTYHQLSK